MIENWSEIAPVALLGATILLAAAWLVGLLFREPIERKRSSELGLLFALLWIPSAFMPMPRLAQSEQVMSIASEQHRAEQRITEPVTASDAGPDRRAELLPPSFSQHPAADTATRRTAIEPTDTPHATSIAATQQSTSPPPPSNMPWSKVWTWSYVFGAALSAVWLLLGTIRLSWFIRTAQPAPSNALAALTTHERSRIRVLISGRPCRPFCCGLLRPTIVLPSGLLEDQALAAVLRHEVAHLRHRDPWSQALFALALPVLWFHPLFWSLRHRIRFAAELLADERAAQDSSRCDYARSMIGLAETHTVDGPAVAIPLFRRPSEFTRRIQMLLKRERPLASSSTRTRCAFRWTFLLTIFCLVFGSMGASPAAAQDSGQVRRERDELIDRVKSLEAELESLRAKGTTTATAVDAERLQILRQIPILASFFDKVNQTEVRAGDDIDSLLARIDLPLLAEFRALNPNLNPAKLAVGEVVRLPESSKNVTDWASRNRTSFASTQSNSADPSPLELATRIIEAEGRLEMTHARMTQAKESNRLELEAELRMHRRTLQLLNRLASGELRRLQQELASGAQATKRLQLMKKKGLVTKAEVHEQQTKTIRIQNLIDTLETVVKLDADK